MQTTATTDTQRLLRKLRREGWTVATTGSGHSKATRPAGGWRRRQGGGARISPDPASETTMFRYPLETIVLVFVLFWLLGAFIVPFGGPFIHLILLLVLVVIVVRVLEGRRRL